MSTENEEIPSYYNETEHLHWNPKIKRKGLGTLLKKVNHIAITVPDIGTSLAFYHEVLGLQIIKRPNFDRVGAWLTLGNVELHLIKGPPVVHSGDNLIVPHISLETDEIDEVLKRLLKMGIQFSRNVSVPDATEAKPVTQYFLKDPDGYYIELCNCSILTEFCLNLNPDLVIAYRELVDQIEITNIFDLALLAESVKHNIKSDSNDFVLPEDQWAEEPDERIVENMLRRSNIWGDCMQGETRESISLALRQANNNAPRAARIIRHKHRIHGHAYIPPSFYLQAADKHDPTALKVIEKDDSENDPKRLKNISFRELAKITFDKFDENDDGELSRDEIYRVLLSLNQAPKTETLDKIFGEEEKISFEKFFEIISKKKTADSCQLQAFFKLLDNDGNKKITVSEFFMAVRALGIEITDREIEEIFIESDIDGDGVLELYELESLLNNIRNDVVVA